MSPTPKQPKPDYLRRVSRGGSWDDASATVVRAAYRHVSTPSSRIDIIGFRCAQRGCRQPVGKVQP